MKAMRILSLPAVALAAACSGGLREERHEDLWSDAPARERTVLASAWDTLWRAGTSEDDTTFLDPLLLRAGAAGVYVFDAADQRLKAFAPDGAPAWAFGRRGSGPGEFRNVRDLKVGALDTLFLLDAENPRLTLLDRGGRAAGLVPLAELRDAPRTVVPLSDGGLLLSTARPDSSLVVLDRRGRVLRRHEMPWGGFEALPAVVRQGVTAAADGDRWVYGFRLGDGWFRFAGGAPVGPPGRFVEHQRFPGTVSARDRDGRLTRLAGPPRCAACAASLEGDTVYFLFGGRTPRARGLVDRFDWATGEYRGSYHLPVRARAVDVRGGVFYVLQVEPYPSLLALRPRDVDPAP